MALKPGGLDPLTRLAIKYGADKWGEHCYTPVYHEIFAARRHLSLRLLEIGVGGYEAPACGGASLRMWAEYFPTAQIVGLDIAPKRLTLDPRIRVIEGSQSDMATLYKLWSEFGPFEIIIDDGSHRAKDVITSFTALYPLMNSGSIYIVEDVQTAFWREGFGGTRDGAGTIIELAHRAVIDMHQLEIDARDELPVTATFGEITAAVEFRRNLIIFHRGSNTYPSNASFN